MPSSLLKTNAGSTAGNSAAYRFDDGRDDSNDPSFFGHFENPDPEDTSPRDMRGDWILLFSGQSLTCNKQYSKTAKIGIFHDSLTIENPILSVIICSITNRKDAKS
jgi:hypothetical protein